MPRKPRVDHPGAWHHVMNRGLAKRPVFTCLTEIRYFLSCLARAVRRGEVEVHAYCILTTHFHLLVRSPSGQLSEGMRRVENDYVRWFNLRNRRDGALFRGRFTSRLVDSVTYLRTLFRYIDQNPVLAGLSRHPAEYPHGSASRLLSRRVPPWLELSWLREELADWTRGGISWQQAYEDILGTAAAPDVAFVVERRSQRYRSKNDPLNDLVGAAPAVVREWMVRTARLADGGVPSVPVCGPETLAEVLKREREDAPAWFPAKARLRTPPWESIHVGLLRELCCLSFREIGLRLGESIRSAQCRYQAHRNAIANDSVYASRAAAVAHAALKRLYGV